MDTLAFLLVSELSERFSIISIRTFYDNVVIPTNQSTFLCNVGQHLWCLCNLRGGAMIASCLSSHTRKDEPWEGWVT